MVKVKESLTKDPDLDVKFQEEFKLCSSQRPWEKDNNKNECVSGKYTTGSVNLQGRGLVLLTGGMGMSQFCSEDTVHGCNVGELQQSFVRGKSLHTWKVWEGLG